MDRIIDEIREAVGGRRPIIVETPEGMVSVSREGMVPWALRNALTKLNREKAERERLERLTKPKQPRYGAGGKPIDTHYTGAIAFRRAEEAEDKEFKAYQNKVVTAQAELRDRLYRENALYGFHTPKSIALATTELGRKMMNVKYPIDKKK